MIYFLNPRNRKLIIHVVVLQSCEHELGRHPVPSDGLAGMAIVEVVLQSCQHGFWRRPDILQEYENYGHLCSNGDTSNLR